MVANTLVNSVQALNVLSSHNLMPPVDAFSPPKKKRGRPPKPNNFSNKITTTLNISVNTSPLSNSPTAENNSNQIVKRGVPDIFTPTMRVSPSGRVKKRRKNSSISSIDSVSPSISNRDRKSNGHSALSTTSSPGINSKALDNISMITANQPIYNTPPPSAIRGMAQKSKDLLPSAFIEAEKSISPTNTTEPANDQIFGPNDDFNLKLMIDDSGKAVLSNDFLNNGPAPQPQQPQQSVNYSRRTQSFQDFSKHQESKPKLYHANSVIGFETNYFESGNSSSTLSDSFNYVSAHEKPGELNVHQQDQSQLQLQAQQQLQAQTQAQHQHQQPESRPVPVKYNSENNWQAISETNPPQTPKFKDNYLLAPTGLTPLSYNLTPQFNSLMYSMLNSPQSKKVNSNSSQFMFNQDFFVNSGVNNVNMNDFMNMNGSGMSANTNLLSHMNNIQTQNQNQNQNQTQTQISGQNYASPAPPYNVNQTFSPDDGDARLALKKKIHVRK